METFRAAEAREDSVRRQREAKALTKNKQAADRLEDDRHRICQALVKCPNGETKTSTRTLAGMSGERFNVALATLLDDGSMVMCDVFKPDRKAPREGYKLA